jgi:hypothetical protein
VNKSANPTPTPPSEEDEVIKVETEAVNVLFTAQDKDRRLLLTLKPEDIKILENGQPQEISAFSKQIDLPLSLAILIDTSASQERTLPEEKIAAIAFIESVIRPTKDEVSVISLHGESTLEQGMTNNVTRPAPRDRPGEIRAAVRIHRRWSELPRARRRSRAEIRRSPDLRPFGMLSG